MKQIQISLPEELVKSRMAWKNTELLQYLAFYHTQVYIPREYSAT